MGSRMIHLAMSKVIEEKAEINDMASFRVGTILPDAVAEPRDVSHYKEIFYNGKNKMINFPKFREQFYNRIRSDDLYLGYYIHLVQDAMYRKFLYGERDYVTKGSREDAARDMYNDFHITNLFLIKAYGIEKSMVSPDALLKRNIEEKYLIPMLKFLKEAETDFEIRDWGKTVYLTEEMAKEFVDRYSILCIDEINSLRRGAGTLDIEDYIWDIIF